MLQSQDKVATFSLGTGGLCEHFGLSEKWEATRGGTLVILALGEGKQGITGLQPTRAP